MSAEKTKRSVDLLRRALDRLEEALAEPASNPLAVDGTIQRFEFAFELTWKALKHALEEEGLAVGTPRDALKRAYAAGWFDDEAAWLGMLSDRNQTSHTYNEETATRIYASIRRNFPEMRRLHGVLAARA